MAHLLEVSYERRAVEPSILSHQPGSVLGRRAVHDGLVPPAVPAGCHRIHDARPQIPSVRPRSEKYGLVLHHDRKSAPFCPRYRACGADLPPPCRVGIGCRGIHGRDLLDENPREHRILRTLHRLYWASGLQRIQFRSFLGVSMFLPASPSASFLIRPYLAREALPGASRRPPMPPPSNRAAHSCTVRWSTSAKSEAIFVEWPLRTPKTAIILLRILISPSACMASVSSHIFLLFSSMGGSAIRRSLSFFSLSFREAKFSMSVTLGQGIQLFVAARGISQLLQTESGRKPILLYAGPVRPLGLLSA